MEPGAQASGFMYFCLQSEPADRRSRSPEGGRSLGGLKISIRRGSKLPIFFPAFPEVKHFLIGQGSCAVGGNGRRH